ncbi:hypothetical protein Tco_0477794 [Tanacetum coccineum]
MLSGDSPKSKSAINFETVYFPLYLTFTENTITNPRVKFRAITTRSWTFYTPVPPIPHLFYDENGTFDREGKTEWKKLVIRDGLERIVFKPDGSQDNESIHMMDAYDDQVKDVCEPESNDDSATSAIVDDFESLLGDIIKQKEELKGISDPVARRRACLCKLD